MFDTFRAYWYYSKLGSTRGIAFERAAMALSQIKTEDSVRYLLDILVSRNDLTIEEKSNLARAFASIGKIASRYLLNQIFDENGEIQYNVVSALGEIRETSAVPTFSFLFEKTDNPIFARALADIGDPEVLPLLRSKITGNSIARLESLEALFHIAPQQEIPFLISLMYSPRMIIRKHVVKMLASISCEFESVNEQNLFFALSSKWDSVRILPGSLSLFCHFVNDEDSEFKREIVQFLVRNDCVESKRVLYEFLSDTDEEFLSFLLTQIKKARINRFELLDQLFLLLRYDSVIVRHLAEELFLGFGDSVLPDILMVLPDSKGTSLLYQTTLQTLCISLGKNQLPLLYRFYKGSDEFSKTLIITILMELCSSAASEFIQQLMGDEGARVKMRAAHALAQTASDFDLPLILALVCDQSKEVRMVLYGTVAALAHRYGVKVEIDSLTIDEEERIYAAKLLAGE